MENIIITGHKNPDTDSICSALSYTWIKGQLGEKVTACRAGNVNPETRFVLDYWKVDAPALVEKVEEGQKIILVDHNEMSQAVDGLDKADLVEIIDHHRLGGIVTSNPLFVRMQPVGCTATILYNVAVENNLTLPKEIAGLLFSAISSDTLYFKSPTTTEKDKEAAGALAKIAGIADP
ncbi:DHH family phosphoesterase, partial [Acidaminococcus fermentans]